MLAPPFSPPPAALGLGTATFGREIDRPAAFQLLDHAVARGITHFDTAALYGAGAAEQILGEWLARHRDRRAGSHVATKIYPPYTPAAITAACTSSLQRLGLGFLDLLYLHKWDDRAKDPAALAALHELVRHGAVRAIGASNFDATQLATIHATQRQHGLTPFTFLQNNHNLAVREAEPGLRSYCATHAIQVVTYSPLGAGFLTGKHRDGVPPGTRFAYSPGHGDIYFNDVCRRRLARLEAVAHRTGIAMPHLAIAWVFHQAGINRVIVGGRGPEHIEQALAARAFDDPSLFSELGHD
ncbi:aldo/keto reductase [Horticoccus sp. 23ND18S-11]|uniref:aldo/keto reductase n=1 Tax=Horticoccus sp. 23ND18S-11 TaxID=3391832 RepID=UPI0039C98095